MGLFRDAIKSQNKIARSSFDMTSHDFNKDSVNTSDGDSKLKGFSLRQGIKDMMGRF